MKFTRKQFLQMSGAAMGAAILGPYAERAGKIQAATAASTGPFLINVILNGGPDFRHLFVPPPSTREGSYGNSYWKYRAGVQGVSSNDPDQWTTRYNEAYTEVKGGNLGSFGILSQAGWLIEQYNAGNVAIIANVKHSESRDHSRSLLVLQTGSYETPAYSSSADGWGGLLGEEINGNLISLTNEVMTFCNRDPARIISYNNSRNFGLYIPEDEEMLNYAGEPSTESQIVMYRALRSYYEKMDRSAMPAYYQKIANHYDRLNNITQTVKSRLAANPEPESIQSLYQNTENETQRLTSGYFGRQIRGLYDAYLTSDILDFRIAALNYGGWDTHKREQEDIEPKLADLFGTDMAFDSIFTEMQGALNNSLVLFSGEFGRQLRNNGDNSTDHGDANYMILVGGSVNGGVYGELFPSVEIDYYDQFWRGIEGRTTFRGALQSVVSKMGGDPANIFQHDLEEESGYGDMANIVS